MSNYDYGGWTAVFKWVCNLSAIAYRHIFFSWRILECCLWLGLWLGLWLEWGWNSFSVLSWRGNGYSGFALRYNGAILELERGCGNVFSPVTLMASSAIGTLSASLYTAALCTAWTTGIGVFFQMRRFDAGWTSGCIFSLRFEAVWVVLVVCQPVETFSDEFIEA